MVGFSDYAGPIRTENIGATGRTPFYYRERLKRTMSLPAPSQEVNSPIEIKPIFTPQSLTIRNG